MIPPLVDGHLPVGTYLCTLEQIEEVFVNSPIFAESSTRRPYFDGLISYLYEWELAQQKLETKLLKRIWIGGSFTSESIEVGDIDISPIIDSDALAAMRGREGIGRVRALFERRDKVRSTYHVEPFAVLWKPFTTLDLRRLKAEEYEYVATRGMMDDFWQRTRDQPIKQAMLVDDAEPTRGYLEVMM